MIRLSKQLALLAGMLLLAACASGPQALTMQIENVDQVYTGVMNTGLNVQDVFLQSADRTVTCEGVSLLGYANPGCRSRGAFRLECTDDRKITGDWTMNDCASGTGKGRDDRDNELTFLIGDAASSALPVEKETQALPAAGTDAVADYLFRIGGDYAAGFGDPAQSGYPVLFEDAGSGMMIVSVGGGAVPTVLSDESPRAGQEAFVVMPADDVAGNARVLAVTLQDGQQDYLRISNGNVKAGGLPVIDANRKVIGLTVQHAGNTLLFGADRLRRYLQMISPALANTPGESTTANALLQRLVVPGGSRGSERQ